MTVKWPLSDAPHPPKLAPPDDVVAIVLAAGKGTRMKSDLPKVLHPLNGRSLVRHVIERVRRVGVRDIVLVIGYKRELVMADVGPGVRYAVQEHQLGTAHAVMTACAQLPDFTGRALVVYGDMPLISPATLRQLIDRCAGDVQATLLTVALENPPDFGRVVRSADGRFVRIVEVTDADPQTLSIREINVGLYCFDGVALRRALARLTNANAQGEYYLTDVVGLIADQGGRVETIPAPTLEETLGINDPDHLRFAEALQHLDYAESVYPLVDASLTGARQADLSEKTV